MASLRSHFDPSLVGGRRRIVQLTLALIVLSDVLYGLFINAQDAWLVPWSRAGIVLALLLLSEWRRLNLEIWGMLCLLAFCWGAMTDMHVALEAGTLPMGLSLWTPVVLIECFVVLGASYGVMVVCLLSVLLIGGFVFYPPVHGEVLHAWLNIIVSCTMFCILGYGFSRFLEEVDQESANSNQALSRARMDALTRVLGRAAAENELRISCQRAQQQKIPLSLIVCDIDHFKKVNDQYGHARGDDVLRAVAQKLRHNTGSIGAKVGRWGGEEFIIIVPRYARSEAITLAEQIRREIAGTPMAGLSITLSLGVASYRHGEEVSTLFERADQASYRAKNAGRNRVEG